MSVAGRGPRTQNLSALRPSSSGERIVVIYALVATAKERPRSDACDFSLLTIYAAQSNVASWPHPVCRDRRSTSQRASTVFLRRSATAIARGQHRNFSTISRYQFALAAVYMYENRSFTQARFAVRIRRETIAALASILFGFVRLAHERGVDRQESVKET